MVGETELQPCSLNCLPTLMHLELPSGSAPAKRDNFAPGTPGFSAGAQGFGLLNFGVQGLAGIPRPGYRIHDAALRDGPLWFMVQPLRRWGASGFRNSRM